MDRLEVLLKPHHTKVDYVQNYQKIDNSKDNYSPRCIKGRVECRITQKLEI